MINILEVHDLQVAVDQKVLLHQLNLCLPAGEVHALLGPNGCGKTTLLMAIMGYPRYRVLRGAILFDGQEIAQCDLTERARLMPSRAHQRPPTLPGVTLRALLQQMADRRQGSGPEHHAGGEELADAFGMAPFLDRSINAGLSGGEIKRSELAQILALRPRLALLDEPDSGIDLESLTLIGRMVQALVGGEPGAPRANGALLVTHTGQILEHVTVDRAHVMLDGRIVCSGPPVRILAHIRRHGFQECARLVGECEKETDQYAHGSAGINFALTQ